jgi:hypothetical protein
MVLKFGSLKKIKYSFKVLKCGAAEGYKRSAETIIRKNEEVLHRVKKTGTSYIQ